MNDLERAHYSRQLCSVNKISDNDLKHWKYVKKERVNGKWKYYYDLDSLKNDVKSKVEDTKEGFKSAVDNFKDKVEDTKDKIEQKVDTAKAKVEDFTQDVKDALDPEKNKYDVTSRNYDTKIKEVAKDPEWQDIVKRKDPEYVKTNRETGETTYDIDSYLVNKKHPYLDVINDIAAGRDITTLKVDADTTVAALKDHIRSKISTLTLAITALSRFLTEKFKYQQGSYDDEIETASRQAAIAVENAKSTYKTASTKASEIPDIITSITSSAEGRELINAGEEYLSEFLKNSSSYRR